MPRRSFQRSLGKRRYRKLFVIAVEGAKTEPQYFNIFNDQQSVIHVNCIKGNYKNSPLQVLKRMKARLQEKELKSSDEAWLVVDKDQWTDEQLGELRAWARSHDNYGFALSNPKFEYWLLLHFEDGTGITSSRDCSDRLKRHLPGYDKGIDVHKITRDRINEAISRAKQRNSLSPHSFGTTVYKLVEKIFQTGSSS